VSSKPPPDGTSGPIFIISGDIGAGNRLVHGRLEGLSYAERGWQVIDTDQMSVEQTVDCIVQYMSSESRHAPTSSTP
jgi:hypothetical protein